MALGSKDSKKKRDKAREDAARRAATREQQRNLRLNQTAQEILNYAHTLPPEVEAARSLRAEVFKAYWRHAHHGQAGDEEVFIRAIARIVQGLPPEPREAWRPRNEIRGIRGGARRASRRRQP